MLAAADPVGPNNDMELMAAATADLLIAAWGTDARADRVETAKRLFEATPVWCLGATKHSHPRHPLYVHGETLPQPFWNCEGKKWSELPEVNR
jgi:hypothetical protein